MKTVSGKIVSSPKDVSLPKAAKILSKFASEDCGASPAFLHYLNRASEAFDELVQLHKELRGSGSDRKSNSRRRSGNQDEVEGPANSMRSYGGDEGKVADGERHELGVYRFNSISVEAKKKKKKKKKSEIDGAVKKEEEGNSESGGGNSAESRKRKKELNKIKKEVSGDGRINGGGGNRISNGEKEEFEEKKIKKVKSGSEGGDGEDVKVGKKRKSEEMVVDGKMMQNKKRKMDN